MSKLSEKVRARCEAAPWVVKEIKRLEKQLEHRFSELESLHLIAKENEQLKDIIRQTLWMARRYADGRSTYAPAMVNECIMKANKLGIELDGPIEPEFAKDGMFGEWNPETRGFDNEKK